MQMSRAFLKHSALITGTLLLAATCHGVQAGYEYDWVGGAPGYSGKIFLDAPSSAASPTGGTLADVLPGSYVTTPLGNSPIFDQPLTATFIGSMQWDQTHISGMFLLFDSTTPIINPYYGLPTVVAAQAGYFGVGNSIQNGVMYGGSYNDSPAHDDLTGHWQIVDTPEPTSFALAGLGCMAFIMFQHRVKRARRA